MKIFMVFIFPIICAIGCTHKPNTAGMYPEMIKISMEKVPDWGLLAIEVVYEATKETKFVCSSKSASDGSWKPVLKTKVYEISKPTESYEIPLIYDEVAFCDFEFRDLWIGYNDDPSKSYPSWHSINVIRADNGNDPLISNTFSFECNQKKRDCFYKADNHSFRFKKNSGRVEKIKIKFTK